MQYLTLHDLVYLELFFAGFTILSTEFGENRRPSQPEDDSSHASGPGKLAITKSRKHEFTVLSGELLPLGPVAVPVAVLASLWIAIVICNFAWLAVAGQDLTFNGRLDAKVYMPLSCGAALQYWWRVAAGVAHYKPATRLDDMVFRWKVAWPIQWALCALWMDTTLEIIAALVLPLVARDACRGLPLLCHLHAAYAESQTAKMCFWSLAAALACGAMAFMLSMMLMKAIVGASLMFAVYQAGIREPLVRFVLRPVMQNDIRPLLSSVWRPISVFTITHLSAPTYRYVTSPLSKRFPGPDTKMKHYFADPSLQTVVGTLVTSPLFILATLVMIGTISEADTHLAPYKDGMSVPLHLAAMYSMMAWILWRIASALNFAPAVRLDQTVYTSRIGWTLQFCVCFPWLYTLWKMLYLYVFVFLLEQESGFGRALVKVSNAGALDLGMFRVNLVGSVFVFVVRMLFAAGLVHTVSFIAFALAVCFQKVAGLVTDILAHQHQTLHLLGKSETRQV